ncbi:fibulin-1 [Gracilinanus agilis]|uniref:fibulin-1 n=1 Tax=Gracilinanus agilis TaxID=191870 RepID=UPI001CFEA018|nr:fibulin-1 [Gracilinanus agilis]
MPDGAFVTLVTATAFCKCSGAIPHDACLGGGMMLKGKHSERVPKPHLQNFLRDWIREARSRNGKAAAREKVAARVRDVGVTYPYRIAYVTQRSVPGPMEPAWKPRPLALLALVLLLAARASADVLLEDCCADGHRLATQKRDCSVPYASESKECRMVQEQCCLNQLEELHCATGINVAHEGDGCDSHHDNSSFEAKFVKKCCHCCLLGKAAQAQGQSCEYNLMIGYQCGLVYRACCVKGQETSELAPGDVAAAPVDTTKIPEEDLVDQEDPYLHDRCRGGGPCTQQCRDTGSAVVCSCFVGYQLLPDGVSCEDTNECITGTHNCRIGEICINTVGAFRCQRESSCGTGYELMEDNTCKDIDECESGIHNCLPNFVCQNTPGSFRCRPKLQCRSGFIQDALGNCIDINECLSINAPCPSGQTCINTEGSYTCQKNVPNCGRGYHLNDEGTRCVDVDECSPPSEPCGAGHLCINTPGSFRCDCKAGYYFDGISRTCADINECRRYPGRLCGHKCENTPGSYHCSCTVGFKLSSDGRSCEEERLEKSPNRRPILVLLATTVGRFTSWNRECRAPQSSRGVTSAKRFMCLWTSPASNGSSLEGNIVLSPSFRCERLPCNENQECQRLPLRITHYHLSFPTTIQVPAVIFRMGPSSAVPGDRVYLAITSGNEEGFFTTQKVSAHNSVVALHRPVLEPRDLLLTVQMELLRHGTLNTFVAKLHVFVTAEL